MYLRIVALAVVAFVASALLAPLGPGGRPVHAATNCDVADLSIDGEEQAFLGLINAYRAQAGAPALSLSQPLTRAATWFAGDMAFQNYFPPDHVDLLGRDTALRLTECDVPVAASAGENIAAGGATGRATLDIWKNSPAHNTIMLDPSYRSIGIARAFGQGTVYGWYWATTYSSEGGGGAPPPPSAPPPPPEPPAPPPPPPVCSSVSLGSNQGATVAPNTAVALTAQATCPGNASYQWWLATVAANGAQSWRALTNYGAPRNFTWTPTAAGNYILGVWAKVDGTNPPGGFDVTSTVNVAVVQPGPAPCTGATLTPAGSTIKVGQAVRLTASATCGGTAQYQWWRATVAANGTQTWTPLTQFGPAKTFDWTPAATGTYLVGFWAKNEGTSPAGGFEVSQTNRFLVIVN